MHGRETFSLYIFNLLLSTLAFILHTTFSNPRSNTMCGIRWFIYSFNSFNKYLFIKLFLCSRQHVSHWEYSTWKLMQICIELDFRKEWKITDGADNITNKIKQVIEDQRVVLKGLSDEMLWAFEQRTWKSKRRQKGMGRVNVPGNKKKLWTGSTLQADERGSSKVTGVESKHVR